MRDYGDVIKRIELLGSAHKEIRLLGQSGGYALFGVRVSRDPELPTVFVNGGTHGDEPAGVEAALVFLEDGVEKWLDHFQFEVIPCLCPHGYTHDTRLNHQGIDGNWAFLKTDVPEVSIIKRFIEGRSFKAVVDLHEDWESPGYYLYEQFRDMAPLGERVTDRVSAICPLNTAPEIEGENAVNGVIHPSMDIERRRKGEGIPIALFQQAYTDHLVTSETPLTLDLEARVSAHLAALDATLQGHADSRTADLANLAAG